MKFQIGEFAGFAGFFPRPPEILDRFPDLIEHLLAPNMRRTGVPQVVRMRFTGHRTDSMERRYTIVDVEDIRTSKEMMEKSAK